VQRWWQRVRSPFDPNRADENGLVGIGGSLDPELVLVAYRSGVFPWSSQPVISWWSPDPRAIFDLDTYKPHRSTQKSVRRGGWRFSVDEAFEPVMRACAEPATGRESTWISEDFVRTYVKLHARGHAHSVEVWDGRDLVGGLYGVTLGGFFGGESMFSRRTIRGPSAGRFHTAVCTVRPCHETSCGRPTFTDSKLPARESMISYCEASQARASVLVR